MPVIAARRGGGGEFGKIESLWGALLHLCFRQIAIDEMLHFVVAGAGGFSTHYYHYQFAPARLHGGDYVEARGPYITGLDAVDAP